MFLLKISGHVRLRALSLPPAMAHLFQDFRKMYFWKCLAAVFLYLNMLLVMWMEYCPLHKVCEACVCK